MLAAASSLGRRYAVPSRLVDWGFAICTVPASPSAPGGYGCSAPTLTAPGSISTSRPITRPLCSSVLPRPGPSAMATPASSGRITGSTGTPSPRLLLRFLPSFRGAAEANALSATLSTTEAGSPTSPTSFPPRDHRVHRALEDAPNCPALQRTRQALLEMDGRWELLRTFGLSRAVHRRHHRTILAPHLEDLGSFQCEDLPMARLSQQMLDHRPASAPQPPS